jgi:hypothetical protein
MKDKNERNYFVISSFKGFERTSKKGEDDKDAI